jgi:predicted dehydrogenase
VEETLLWQLEFPGGIVCNSSTTYSFYIERLRVFAENGHYELSPAYGYGPLKGFSSKGTIDLPHTHHQTLQMDAMVESILSNTTSTASGEEGLRDMKILEAIYRAAETGRRISLA